MPNFSHLMLKGLNISRNLSIFFSKIQPLPLSLIYVLLFPTGDIQENLEYL